jgi:hypothetical protein
MQDAGLLERLVLVRLEEAARTVKDRGGSAWDE